MKAKTLAFILIACASILITNVGGKLFEVNAHATLSAANSDQQTSLIDSILSKPVMNSEVVTVETTLENERLPFNYSSSISTLENRVYSALLNITNSSLFLSALQSDLNYSDVYLTPGMTYNYSTQQYGVYAMINVRQNSEQTTETFAYASNNGTIYGSIVTHLHLVMLSTEYISINWGGYEFYYPENGIEYNSANVNISTITDPNNTIREAGMAGWIGLTVHPGASDGNLIQTGFYRNFYDGTGNPYIIFYETLMAGNTSYYGTYPNISTPQQGWDLSLSISNEYPSLDKVNYEITVYNVSETSITSNNWYVKTMYAQYITEAPLQSVEYNGYYYPKEIAQFTPKVTFMYANIMTTAGYNTVLNYLYDQGDYNYYIMNQTYNTSQNQPNENVLLGYTYQNYGGVTYWEPQMTYHNSIDTQPGV